MHSSSLGWPKPNLRGMYSGKRSSRVALLRMRVSRSSGAVTPERVFYDDRILAHAEPPTAGA